MYHISNSLFVAVNELPMWVLYTGVAISISLHFFGLFLGEVGIFSLLAKHLPDGFETTGMTLAKGFVDLGKVFSDWLQMKEFWYFRVGTGYYYRIRKMILFDTLTNLFFVVISPLFLVWRPPKRL